MNILKGLKNWRIDGNVNAIHKDDDNSVNEAEIRKNFVVEEKDIPDNVAELEVTDEVGQVENKSRFFDRIAILGLLGSRKSKIAERIVDDSYPDKLYWIQFTLSSMIVALGLLMNSIPVIIGAMLISPILNPIKTFAFAIATGNKHMYIRSIKTLIVSMFVAILASVFISFIVPFSTLTTEVMSRISPTIVDLFVALFSGAVAFLSLGFKRLQENVAGAAMSVALLPPLSVIGIGIFFMDFSVAQGSFLLFMANLVAILIIGVIIFYMFGFFPTNKKGQKRSFVIGIMIFLSLLIVIIPLQQSMTQISDNIRTMNQISLTSKNYLESINDNIQVNEISFKNMTDNLLRVSIIINVPDDYLLTNKHKNELTKLLSMATQKSVELDLDIVEISSVYVGEEKTDKDLLMDNISKVINANFRSVFIVDHSILEKDHNLIFLNLYTDNFVDKDDIYETILQEVKKVYGTGGKLVIQWQENNGILKKDKTQQERDLEKQFYTLFPNSQLNLLNVDTVTKELSGDNHDYVYVTLDFATPKTKYRVRQLLKDWKLFLEEYLKESVIINSKIAYFSEFEI